LTSRIVPEIWTSALVTSKSISEHQDSGVRNARSQWELLELGMSLETVLRGALWRESQPLGEAAIHGLMRDKES
jgi:hypothetical protein